MYVLQLQVCKHVYMSFVICMHVYAHAYMQDTCVCYTCAHVCTYVYVCTSVWVFYAHICNHLHLVLLQILENHL